MLKAAKKVANVFMAKAPWKKHQAVQHKKFGIGIIQKVDESKNAYNLTIKFKVGVKKIASSFVIVI